MTTVHAITMNYSSKVKSDPDGTSQHSEAKAGFKEVGRNLVNRSQLMTRIRRERFKEVILALLADAAFCACWANDEPKHTYFLTVSQHKPGYTTFDR